MRKNLFYLLLLLVFTNVVQAQKKEPAILRFYRSDKLLCNSYNFDLEMNNRYIYTMKPGIKKGGAFEYTMVSEGTVNINVKNWMNSWHSSTVLNVESGKTYYIKIDCSIYGIYLSTNRSLGEEEWPQMARVYTESLAEDPGQPIIPRMENNDYNSSARVIVKTDTVKKIVYVNAPDDKKFKYERKSDVDNDIPFTSTNNDMQFALIIGNEDYNSFQTDLKTESNVDFARNDASAFRDYARGVLGIPEKNITFLTDATYGQISQALSKINLIEKNTGGKAEIVFYYAGHGMPDEETKEPYLIPVDISGSNVTSGIKLKDLYSKLTEYPTQRVLVFLDACFTGGARGEGLIAGRGVSIKPKEEPLKGNIVVFNSSSGSQSSLAYKDKYHGMYTYFLLKKLKESKGNLTLSDLAKYVNEKVSLETVLVNNKEQSPQTNTSSEIADKWGSWKLNDK
jgi:hypothetical protein